MDQDNVRPISYISQEDVGSHAYDNTGYMPPESSDTASGITGDVESLPRIGHPSLKQDERGAEDESHQRNKRRRILVPTLVVSTLLLCAIIGALIFVFVIKKDDPLPKEKDDPLPKEKDDPLPKDCPTGRYRCGDRSICDPEEEDCYATTHCPDLSIEESDCQGVYKLECTFEDEFPNEMCFYKNLDEENFWKSSFSRVNQLPAADHNSNKSARYMYTPTFIHDGTHNNVTLRSATVLYNTDMCVTFWYFMNSTRFQPDGVTAQLFVYVDYPDDFENLYWYDSADRYTPDWIQGAVPLKGNRAVKLQFTAKTSSPVSFWPGLVAVDDIDVKEGSCSITQNCSTKTFNCQNTGACIPSYFICDGTSQCSDKSDESNCTEKQENVIEVIGGDGSYGRVRMFMNTTRRPVCFSKNDSDIVATNVCRSMGYSNRSEAFYYTNADSNQEPVSLNCTSGGKCTPTVSICTQLLGVKCSNDVCFSGKRLCNGSMSHCIPESRFCDGLQDCDGNTDELGCVTCETDEFECGNHICVPRSDICDGKEDCHDGTDEFRCETCARQEFECGNHKCVSLSDRCNGKEDCSDGTDEFRCVQVVGKNVTVWDHYAGGRYPVCFDGINKDTAQKLCQLSGNGYLVKSGFIMGKNKVLKGVQVLASQDPTNRTLARGLYKIGETKDCYPLHLTCALPECGTTIVTESAMQQYIIYGDKAVLGEYPWHCAIYNEAGYWCGASYIGNSYFLTAAHCVPTNGFLTVKCGTISLLHLGEHGSNYTITKRTRYPLYGISGGYDIAVLQAAISPTIDNFTRPVCLGNSEKWAFTLGRGKAAQCYTTGFGRTENIDENRELLETRVEFINCSKTTAEDFLCIKSDSSYPPTCKGDSGSPTVCKDPRDGRWYQFALTSNHFGCYTTGNPDKHTNVFHYLEWIEERTGMNFTKA